MTRLGLIPDLPVPGEAAPGLSLPQCGGLGPWRLEDQRGKARILLAFVGRLAGRRGLAAAQAWWGHQAACLAHGVEVVVVAEEGLPELRALGPWPGVVLSDPEGVAAGPYGAWRPLFARRSVLVDGQGRVRLVQAGAPQPEALLTFLAGLRGDWPGGLA